MKNVSYFPKFSIRKGGNIALLSLWVGEVKPGYNSLDLLTLQSFIHTPILTSNMGFSECEIN